MSTSASIDAFEPHREFLVRFAYRMLGSLAEAEDVVQDAFLRWRDVDHARSSKRSRRIATSTSDPRRWNA